MGRRRDERRLGVGQSTTAGASSRPRLDAEEDNVAEEEEGEDRLDPSANRGKRQ